MNKLIFRKFYDILTFFILSTMSFTLIVWVIQGVNLLDIVSEQSHNKNLSFIFNNQYSKNIQQTMIFTYFLTLLLYWTGTKIIMKYWYFGLMGSKNYLY